MKARIVAWRRSFSLAMVGLAAGAVLLMSTAGPASASGVVDQMEKTRLTDMPEFSYQIREELIDLVSCSALLFCWRREGGTGTVYSYSLVLSCFFLFFLILCFSSLRVLRCLSGNV